ncbi:MAG: GNAT family protein [Solirubrobacterales bacterium]
MAGPLVFPIGGIDDGGPLDSVGIVAIAPEEGRCELGYWLAREGRGRGAATRSVLLLSHWIFENLDIHRIVVCPEPANGASRAVAVRAGFSEDGLLRSYLVIKGRRRDVASYVLLCGEISRWSRSSGA